MTHPDIDRMMETGETPYDRYSRWADEREARYEWEMDQADDWDDEYTR